MPDSPTTPTPNPEELPDDGGPEPSEDQPIPLDPDNPPDVPDPDDPRRDS